MTDAKSNSFDQGVSESIQLNAGITSVLVLSGPREHDRFVGIQNGNPRIFTLEGLVYGAADLGVLWQFDPADGVIKNYRTHNNFTFRGDLPAKGEANAGRIDKADLISRLAGMETDATPPMRMALMVNAGMLFEDAAHLRDADHVLAMQIEHFARSQGREGKLLVLRVPFLHALPAVLTTSPFVRVLHLPSAGRDERLAYARIRCTRLAEQCGTDHVELANVLGNSSDGWCLEQIETLIQLCEKQALSSVTDVEATARAFRLGVTRSAWTGEAAREAIRKAPELLSERVRGQDEAIRAVCDTLVQAAVGLADATQDGPSRRPRVFFMAGPTGSGKTLMAKTLATLLCGSEDAYIRIDMSEYKEAHSLSRLIGSPPGYVGSDQGGVLVEAVRARPHSLILLDEIEKASSAVYDVLLQMTDDGVLTDGRNQKADFSETVIVITTNLGTYSETVCDDGTVIRTPRFDYTTPFNQIQESIRAGIREAFVTKFNRPELLGRLGGEESIICFDFLRDLCGVTERYIRNLQSKSKSACNVDLVVDAEVTHLIARRAAEGSNTLSYGARGLETVVNTVLTKKLSRFIWENNVQNCRIAVRVMDDGVRFSIEQNG